MSASSPTVDTFELAQSGGHLEGECTIAQLPRLAELVASTQGSLRYQISGLIDTDSFPAADLHLNARLQLICQRCNGPLEFKLDRTTRFRFVANEEELNALPIDDDENEAIVGSQNVNVRDWIEDEAILSLPLVPRHDACAAPLGLESDPGKLAAPNPFAVLLELRADADGTKRSN
jgi:uncharacterized protein